MTSEGPELRRLGELQDGPVKQPRKRTRWFWLTCGLGALLLLIFSAAIIPCYAGAKPVAVKNACINNLRMIEGAKEQWALENKKEHGAVPNELEIYGTKESLGGYMKYPPECRAGGKYVIGAIGTEPICSLSANGHRLR